MSRIWRRGDVCWCLLDKERPALILTKETLIPHLNSVTVAPLTTNVRGIASQVILETIEGVRERSAVSLDNIQTVPKSCLGDYITTLMPFRMKQVRESILYAFDLESVD